MERKWIIMANKETGWYCRHKASIVETTNTSVKIKVECFWQNDGWYYQINNVSAWVYCNGEAVKVKNAGSINTTSNSQSVSCGSATFTISKSTSAKSISCYAKITSNSSYVSGTKSSSSTNVSVPAKPSYKVAYNANGGSGAPSSQTKWYGTNLTLSSTKPTRTGYKFQGWGTSASDTTVDYAAGATYSANAAITLYAIWKANTYTVSYNANGGSGAPGSQTKTYGVNLTLSSAKPTRTNYNFKGWGTSASSTSVAYAAGATYKGNASITLYAIWELAYKKPRITSVAVKRCNSSGNSSDTGTYVGATFSWATDKTVSAIELYYKKSTASSWSSATTVSASGTSGSVSNKVFGGGDISANSTYDVLIRVKDSGGQTDVKRTVGSTAYPIDIKTGGTGIAFNKTAETDNLFDVNWNAKLLGITIPNESGLTQPSGRLMGMFTDGTLCHIASISSSDNIALGYGSYNSKKGKTNIYGYDINFNISNLAENTQYKPYFSRGDTLDVNIYTGGYITSSSTSLYFTIPLAKPIIGAPTISISSLDGFRLRQNGNYTHGSSSNGFCKPSSFSVTRYANLGLCVVATFSNVTNAVNNAPIGIDFNGRITFS